MNGSPPIALFTDLRCAATVPTDLPVGYRIQPTERSPSTGLGLLWHYRELIYFLGWRDIKLRYKQTWIGSTWAIIQPFATMVVFNVIFGTFAKIPSKGLPYPIFAYSALLPWQFFSGTITACAGCLVNNQNLIRKVYFPRAVLPAATVLPGLVDFANAFLVLLGMMLWYHITPGIRLLMLPVFLGLTVASALGVGIWLAALNAKYRDIHHMIPFLIQILFFISPITYPSDLIPRIWRPWYGLNPMVGAIEGIRWSLLNTADIAWPMVATSLAVTAPLLFFGMRHFRSVERTLADIV